MLLFFLGHIPPRLVVSLAGSIWFDQAGLAFFSVEQGDGDVEVEPLFGKKCEGFGLSASVVAGVPNLDDQRVAKAQHD